MMPTLLEADVQRVATVPLDFVEEVQLAEARKDRDWLRLMAENVRIKHFAQEEYKLIGRPHWKLKDFKVAAKTWRTFLRMAQPDVDAELALPNLYGRLYRYESDRGHECIYGAIRRLLVRQNLSSSSDRKQRHSEAAT